MRQLILSAALGALLAAPAATAGAQSVDAALNRALATYRATTSARATFEQTLTNPVTGSTRTAKGQYYQQKPNLLAIRFTDPKGDAIVADGKALWIYVPSTTPGQVVKAPLGADQMGAIDPVAQLLERPREKYTITGGGTERIGGRTADVLVLVPKATAPFTKARVWIDRADGTVRQFEVTDASGLQRRVRLTSLVRNKGVPAGVFTFTVPKGVQVFAQPGA